MSRWRWRFGSVRVRTTVAATAVTALVLGLASVLIVQLVERDLENNARAALSDALESASHAASGEESAGGGVDEGAESSQPESGPASGDIAQQRIADASIREVQAGVDAASEALWVIVPVVVLLLGVAIWLTVGRALRPVHNISSQVAAISGSTIGERVSEPDSADEIAELAALMNQMLDRLEAASNRQREFVADASHELKSPLSTIVAAVEVAEVSPDPQKLQKLASKIGIEARRMQDLVGDLLDLARLDEQRHQQGLSSVDVAAICDAVAKRLGDSGAEIELSIAESTEVLGVATQVERAVFNVLQNAADHAGSRVRVSAKPLASSVEILVEDNGPGIPEVDRERVFERFVRLDESRGRTSGGTGIGLALVRAIVDRHGGLVEIGDSPTLGGARVRIELPRGDEISAADQLRSSGAGLAAEP